MTASREKGRRAEIEVAKLCEGWWGRLEPGCRFVRTPQSGGWHGPDVRAEFQAGGDLMTTAQRWPFSVEVKRREGWNLENLLLGRRSPAWGWWAQCCAAAAEDGRLPLMFFRRSLEPWRAMLDRKFRRLYDRAALPLDGHVPAGLPREPVVMNASDLLHLSPAIVLRHARRAA